MKHAAPQIREDCPSRSWVLSTAGRRQAEHLHGELSPYEPSYLFSSEEAKAAETAEILGNGLGLPCSSLFGLHENDRTDLPFFDREEEYAERFRAFFDHPSDRMIGKESADDAHDRFAGAVRRVLATTRRGTTIIVAHGTVTSLLVSRANELEPYPFWRDFDFTSFVVLSVPSLELRAVVHPRRHEKPQGS